MTVSISKSWLLFLNCIVFIIYYLPITKQNIHRHHMKNTQGSKVCLFVCLYVCLCLCVCVMTAYQSRFFPLPCGSQELNSGCETWWQTPLPTEPSCSPKHCSSGYRNSLRCPGWSGACGGLKRSFCLVLRARAL